MAADILLNGTTYSGIENITLPTTAGDTQRFVLPEDSPASIGEYSQYTKVTMVSSANADSDMYFYTGSNGGRIKIKIPTSFTPKFVRIKAIKTSDSSEITADTPYADIGLILAILDFNFIIGSFKCYNSANGATTTGMITSGTGAVNNTMNINADNSKIYFGTQANCFMIDGITYDVEFYG